MPRLSFRVRLPWWLAVIIYPSWLVIWLSLATLYGMGWLTFTAVRGIARAIRR